MLARGINNGFDLEAGYYKVVVGDHLTYRYEVIQDLDKGAFG
jgi:dual specificity tyrosine-phosphorylation-regulated kinase 2/3/4